MKDVKGVEVAEVAAMVVVRLYIDVVRLENEQTYRTPQKFLSCVSSLFFFFDYTVKRKPS